MEYGSNNVSRFLWLLSTGFGSLNILFVIFVGFVCFFVFRDFANHFLILFWTFSAGNYFGLFMTLIVLILVGRAAFVFPLSALSNYMRKSSDTKITFRQQVISSSYNVMC